MKSVNLGRQLFVVAGLMAVISLVGCGKAKKPWETAHPTAGKVQMDGVPLTDAQITLVPLDKDVPETVRPRGFTDKFGSFELSTYGENDGAPAGKYKLLAMRFPVIGSAESPSQGPNDLPPQYSKAETSDLTVEIQPKGTELSGLELKR